MTLRICVACLLVLAVVCFTGCSSEKATEKMIEKSTGAKDVDINSNKDSVKIKTDQGEMEVSGGESVKLPDGFPSEFPIYKGSKVNASSKSSVDQDQTTYTVLLNTSDDPSKVADYYKSALPDSGYEISGNVEMQGNVSLMLKKGDEDVGIVVISKPESGEDTVISITLTE